MPSAASEREGETTLSTAMSASTLRAQGHQLVDQLADYLERAHRREGEVLPMLHPNDEVLRWRAKLDDTSPFDVPTFVSEILDGSTHFHHPGNVGHQVSAPLPIAALMDLLGAFLNNGMAVFETGPVATAIEQTSIQWLAGQIGWPNGDGVLTSGGSLGNLTALLAARQSCAGYDSWSEGAHHGPPLALVVSEQAHYCVGRAARIMGWGDAGVVLARTDERFRMQGCHVVEALERAAKAGRKVVAVVASACTTATGSFDNLDEIADVCERHGVWMHVDGAHGASMLLSRERRHLLRGAERADSLVWDAHKMMLSPALVTAVLFRERKHSFEAFSQQASYLFSGVDPREQWFNLGQRTLECTKRMMGLQLYVTLKTLGAQGLEQHVDRTCELARGLASKIERTQRLELAVSPDCNIVCFRHDPGVFGSAEARDRHQEKIRETILRSGRFYLVQTRLPKGVFLRTTIINSATTERDLDELLAMVLSVGDELTRRLGDDVGSDRDISEQ